MKTLADPDIWLRRQFWQHLWFGPAAVAAYVSLAIQSTCTLLSSAAPKELFIANLVVLSIDTLLSALLIIVDASLAFRKHRLGILRSSALRSRGRVEDLGLRFELLDRFVNALWLSREMEQQFHRTRVRSVELLIEALDILSETAIRYGRRGRKIFVVNQIPVFDAMRALEYLPQGDAETMIEESVMSWLRTPLKFDPEGWGQSFFTAL